MTGAASRRKGIDYERQLVTWLAAHGWPHAERRGGGFGGSDVVGTPGLTFEAKARAGLRLGEWTDQTERARAAAGDRYGVLCVKRWGVADVGQWFAVMPLADLARLLAEAGWAEPREVTP